ncbi:hypothetical protein ACWKSP_33900 [Micromonosporaceae bacterium Da 78-11]
MCRLFGLSAAPARITATFWLAEAPDSLTAQSHREPDGVGLGYFGPDGTELNEPTTPAVSAWSSSHDHEWRLSY